LKYNIYLEKEIKIFGQNIQFFPHFISIMKNALSVFLVFN